MQKEYETIQEALESVKGIGLAIVYGSWGNRPSAVTAI
jgi:hypothetical protein